MDTRINAAQVRELIAAAHANPAPLADWERDFLRDVKRKRGDLTARQAEALARIAEREPVDFVAVNRAAQRRAEDVCRRLLPRGSRRGKNWLAGDLSGEPGQSLRVGLDGERAGRWIDNATGERGGDFISLAAAVARVSQVEAARQLARMLGVGGQHGG